MATVLDDGEAIPLFSTVGEEERFLTFRELRQGLAGTRGPVRELGEFLEYWGDEVEYVALSPSPENLESGMEVQVIHHEILSNLLKRQTTATPPKEDRGGFCQRPFGHYVAESLRCKLLEVEHVGREAAEPTDELEAYELYLTADGPGRE